MSYAPGRYACPFLLWFIVRWFIAQSIPWVILFLFTYWAITAPEAEWMRNLMNHCKDTPPCCGCF
jgi:hypothetical protein